MSVHIAIFQAFVDLNQMIHYYHTASWEDNNQNYFSASTLLGFNQPLVLNTYQGLFHLPIRSVNQLLYLTKLNRLITFTTQTAIFHG